MLQRNSQCIMISNSSRASREREGEIEKERDRERERERRRERDRDRETERREGREIGERRERGEEEGERDRERKKRERYYYTHLIILEMLSSVALTRRAKQSQFDVVKPSRHIRHRVLVQLLVVQRLLQTVLLVRDLTLQPFPACSELGETTAHLGDLAAGVGKVVLARHLVRSIVGHRFTDKLLRKNNLSLQRGHQKWLTFLKRYEGMLGTEATVRLLNSTFNVDHRQCKIVVFTMKISQQNRAPIYDSA